MKTHQARGIFWLWWWALPRPRADPPTSRPSWWPLGLASIPQSRQPDQGPGLPRSLRPLWDWRGFLFLSALLLLPHPVLEQEGPHRGNPQWQNRSLRLSRPAEGFGGNVWQMGSWVFGGGSSEEKEKEEEKYQREVVFCFHTHTRRCPPTHTTNNWMLAWLRQDQGQGQTRARFFSETLVIFSVTRTSLWHLTAHILHPSKDF